MPLSLAVPALGLLAFAAWRDVATRTIPDGVSVCLAGLGLAVRAFAGWHALALSLAVATGLFALLLVCHARGAIGGGDVKLLTALALGLSPLGSYQLVAATAVIGGALGVLYFALPRLIRGRPTQVRHPTSLLRRIVAIEAWRMRRRGPLPYGVAIALSGALVLLRGAGG
jgi:prepilin peptidase CpaA